MVSSARAGIIRQAVIIGLVGRECNDGIGADDNNDDDIPAMFGYDNMQLSEINKGGAAMLLHTCVI